MKHTWDYQGSRITLELIKHDRWLGQWRIDDGAPQVYDVQHYQTLNSMIGKMREDAELRVRKDCAERQHAESQRRIQENEAKYALRLVFGVEAIK